MKTTVAIPDQTMADLMELTQAKTKREAINKAIEDYVMDLKIKRVLALQGTVPDAMTDAELEGARASWDRHI